MDSNNQSFYKMAPISYVCDICGLNFSSKKIFRDHHAKYHEKEVECQHCSKMFPTTANLKQHNRDVHTKNVKCECCDKTFAKKANLMRHLQRVENKPVQNDTEDFTCHLCMKPYGSKNSQGVHMSNVHSNNLETHRNKAN